MFLIVLSGICFNIMSEYLYMLTLLFVGSILLLLLYLHISIYFIKIAKKLFTVIKLSSILLAVFLFCFLVCKAMFKCILQNLLLYLLFNITLNSNVLKSYQLGEAYTLCGCMLQICPCLDIFAMPGRYLIRSNSMIPSSHTFLSL